MGIKNTPIQIGFGAFLNSTFSIIPTWAKVFIKKRLFL